MPLLAGSPARGAGDVADLPHDTFDLNHNRNTTEPLPIDARGLPRVVDGTLDIGAFEVQAPPSLTATAANPTFFERGRRWGCSRWRR
jgi:hypothetical protein